MKTAPLTFTRCIVNNSEYQRESEQMVSSVFFTLEVEGGTIEDVATLKHAVGSHLEKGLIEVQPPERSQDIVDQDDFAQKTRDYFQDLWEAEGTAMRDLAAPNVEAGHRIIDRTRKVEVALRKS